jgi:hypothetical protein
VFILLLAAVGVVTAGPPVSGHGESVTVGALTEIAAPTNTLFDPDTVPTLGILRLSSGDLVFNTGSTGALPTVSGAISATGVVGVSASTNVQVALFAFDKISLGSNVSVTVTGNLALALLSRQHVMIDTTIDVSGAMNSIRDGGEGGPGGYGGGDGGHGSFVDAAGHGPGGAPEAGGAGGGGGHGGAGGAGSPGGAGGGVNGSDALVDLDGGSGGAGGTKGDNRQGGGAGGGGALVVIAEGVIELSAAGRLLANGGDANGGYSGLGSGVVNGGGGAGGAIVLAASAITLDPDAQVYARGGAGGTQIIDWRYTGGKGGGGRVAFYSPEDYGDTGQGQAETNLPSCVSVDPGATGAGTPGSGSFYDGPPLEFLHARLAAVLVIQ